MAQEAEDAPMALEVNPETAVTIRALAAATEAVTAKHGWMFPFIPGYLKRQQKLYLDDLRKELLK